jgi:4-hydroxythreonine-4-phosphate dehydrogenase
MGDPTGIGPEVIIKALLDRSIREKVFPVVFGDKGVLVRVAQDIGITDVRFREIALIDGVRSAEIGRREILVKSISNLKMTKLRYGRPDRNCGRAMVNYIKEAVDAAMAGYIDAIVTAPINKEAINEAGFRYGGHTDMIADFTGTKEFTMMFISKHFKVSLVTIHVPLKDVSMRITPQRIYKVGLLTWKTLRQYFGLKNPKIGVCGLNPHAGEGGIFGDEEKDLIYPGIVSMRSKGIDAEGPLSPDSAFWRAYNKEFDAIIAMYHDQGLIPVKLIDFDNAVNVTIGIPIIRTSPGHGTAYNIAGQGKANPEPLKSAIELAYQMFLTKKQIEAQKKFPEKEDLEIEEEIKRYRVTEQEIEEYVYL